MKAALVRAHGGPEAIELTDVDDPRPSPGVAVVRVRAVALNHLDIWVRRGVPGAKFPLPMILGSEIAGTIEALPDGASGWRLGDDVLVAPGTSCGVCIECASGWDPHCRDYGILGETSNGGAAEFAAVPVRNLMRKPSALSFAEAASMPLDFLTAWHMLVARARLRPGDTVLVHAGASGVGSAAVQIAKLWGATVLATAGSEAKAERARALGADRTILYRETDFAKEIRELTGKRGVDVVIEHVGRDTWDGSVRSLARGGRLVTCGATTGHEVTVNLRVLFAKGISLLGSTMGSLAEMKQVVQHIEAGTLRPVVDRVLPLAEIREGHRVLEAREAAGKVVLEVG
ncbi:MAG: zinc-binding dehydrogenase [Acidobacteria bacterium]|nr:zinc-binding dehydrogenase [Acidobacteriota bacterium]